MPQIEIYQRYYPPRNYEEMPVRLTKRDFSDNLKSKDKERIEDEWQAALKKNPGIFSVPRELATLYDTQNGILTFDTTDFKTYLAISRTWRGLNFLPAKAYNLMRIAAVGAVVYLEDGYVFVHKRAKNATHVPNAWDSSVAGLAHIRNGREINFLHDLYEKLQRELYFTQEEIEASGIKVTGVHSSREPDFSGAMSFAVHTTLRRSAIERRARGRFEEYTILKKKELTEFILANYIGDDVCLDGAATLLQSLPQTQFSDLVNKINACKPKIRVHNQINKISKTFSSFFNH